MDASSARRGLRVSRDIIPGSRKPATLHLGKKPLNGNGRVPLPSMVRYARSLKVSIRNSRLVIGWAVLSCSRVQGWRSTMGPSAVIGG
jgi:hypothetical protein